MYWAHVQMRPCLEPSEITFLEVKHNVLFEDLLMDSCIVKETVPPPVLAEGFRRVGTRKQTMHLKQTL